MKCKRLILCWNHLSYSRVLPIKKLCALVASGASTQQPPKLPRLAILELEKLLPFQKNSVSNSDHTMSSKRLCRNRESYINYYLVHIICSCCIDDYAKSVYTSRWDAVLQSTRFSFSGGKAYVATSRRLESPVSTPGALTSMEVWFK